MNEITYKILKKEIVICLGKQEFYISKEKFLKLINLVHMTNLFDDQLGPDDNFDSLRCAGTVATYDWLKGKNYDEDIIATVMNISQAKLRNWLSEDADVIDSIRKNKADAVRAICSRFDQARPQRLSELEDR